MQDQAADGGEVEQSSAWRVSVICAAQQEVIMRSILSAFSIALVGSSILAVAQPRRPAAPPQPMSFFVTSAGSGNGANLGGLAGADRICQTLAAAAGGGSKTWHAYLSAAAASGQPAVNARDRIGAGPWYNAKGARIAQNVADLHGDTLESARRGNNITKATALTEKGEPINGVGDTPNRHDMITGSQLDGTAFTDGADHTCGNYTNAATRARCSSAITTAPAAGTRRGTRRTPSRGCSQENLVGHRRRRAVLLLRDQLSPR